ncbi:MAG: phage tail protein [Acetobacter peroxydans]|jgi:prophage tail gpP-like protein|nr:phage tail protein [Acetobacter peroxydans]
MSILSTLVGGSVPDINTDVTFTIGGVRWEGWQDIRISRGCERMPADFDIAVTEKYLDPGKIDIQPGAPCTLSIGSEKVIDGYVDIYGANIAPDEHGVRIAGRSRCSDIVDAHAVVPNGQLGNCDIVRLATELCKPFGVQVLTQNVTLPADAKDRIIQYFNVNLGQTPYELIEQCARYMALLVYDNADGNLVLASVGTTTHASGFAEGVNVMEAIVSFRMDERFSQYLPIMFSVQPFNDYDNPNQGNSFPMVPDPGVPRYRPFFVISEQFDNRGFLAERRAKWEMQRRRGRSQSVRLVCDSWHDSAGKLWTPNMLAPLHLPSLKLPQMGWLPSSPHGIAMCQNGR